MDDPELPLHSLRTLNPAGPALHFWLVPPAAEGGGEGSGTPPEARLRLRAEGPGVPEPQRHEGELSLSEFRTLVAALADAGQARPTLVFRRGAGVALHLTTRSRRPGRLSVRTEGRPDVLNFSPLSPVTEEFLQVLRALADLNEAQ